MKSLFCRGRGWAYCAILLALAIAVFIQESSGRPDAGIVSAPRRSRGPQSPRSAPHSPPQPRQSRRVTRPIARPAECSHDIIFADCYLCGKIAEEILIYRQCCERETATVDFCTQLLT